VNVVPWTHPPLVAAHAAATELAVNVPYARETAKGKKSDCDPDNYVAKHGTPAADDMVCYGLVANDDDEDEVGHGVAARRAPCSPSLVAETRLPSIREWWQKARP
jgi:hypothetical protein